jgi:DNA-binding GntR family transcriptional regulator
MEHVVAPKHSFQTKKDIAVSRLREAVLSGELEPGTKLTQQDLAKRLGMSATPIREAMRELQAQGILSYEGNKGVVVSEGDIDVVSEVYEMQTLLEARLTALACPNLTQEDLGVLEQYHTEMSRLKHDPTHGDRRQLNYQFHWHIYERAQRPQWAGVVGRLWLQFPWDTLQTIPGRLLESEFQHGKILDALGAQDSSEAERRMAQHVLSGFEALTHYLGRRPSKALAGSELDGDQPA